MLPLGLGNVLATLFGDSIFPYFTQNIQMFIYLRFTHLVLLRYLHPSSCISFSPASQQRIPKCMRVKLFHLLWAKKWLPFSPILLLSIWRSKYIGEVFAGEAIIVWIEMRSLHLQGCSRLHRVNETNVKLKFVLIGIAIFFVGIDCFKEFGDVWMGIVILWAEVVLL